MHLLPFLGQFLQILVRPLIIWQGLCHVTAEWHLIYRWRLGSGLILVVEVELQGVLGGIGTASPVRDKLSQVIMGILVQEQGVYARFMGKEYVITQPIDEFMDNASVESVLRAEYSLLCIGDVLKQEFDCHAKECGIITILKFYFNFKDSILGYLVPSLTSRSRHLTHGLFIATPLLPCSDVDGKIKKFTGNDEFGEADDHLTKAIHDFSHFTATYTQQNIVLCDLQGLYDRDKIMCLIDPQGHTATRTDNSCYEYWDGGSKKLKKYLEKHEPACNNNWICQALGL